MTTIRFLHTADLHLGSPFVGMSTLPKEHAQQLRDSTIAAYDHFIQYAVQSTPDFVLFVGDIFDGEKRSLRVQLHFLEGLKKLADANIQVFITHGNHDHLAGSWAQMNYPDNVFVFPKQVETKTITIRGESVHIVGFSYPQRHVTDPMIHQYPPAIDDAFHIGMLHGSIAGDRSHAVYAPFTKEQLLAKKYHYWALGHIHVRHRLHKNPPIIYPGTTQGRHRKEKGIKGFYDVSLSKEGVNLKFIETSAILFESITVSCAGVRHVDAWLERCIQAIEAQQFDRGTILVVNLVEIDAAAAALFRHAHQEEWVASLRTVLADREPFCWIDRCVFHSRRSSEVSNRLVQNLQEMMEQWTDEDWMEIVHPLYQQPQNLHILQRFSQDEMQQLENKAIELLIDRLRSKE